MKKPILLQRIGIIICAIGGIITLGTFGLATKLGLPIITIGVTFMMANWIINKVGPPTIIAHIVIAGALSTMYIFLTFNYTRTTVLRVKSIAKAQELAIICGAEGHDALPSYTWWKREIKMPANNLIITSTELSDISTHVIVIDDSGNEESNYNQGRGQNFCLGPLSVLTLHFNYKSKNIDWTFSEFVSKTIMQLCKKRGGNS